MNNDREVDELGSSPGSSAEAALKQIERKRKQARCIKSIHRKHSYMVEHKTEIHQRPSGPIRDEIVSIAKALTSKWFTSNVPEDTYYDLGFQDVMVLRQSETIVSFIMFTCLDGDIHISLMGTRPEFIGNGYGSKLMNAFFDYVKDLGFQQIIVYTVPPDTKPSYYATVAFYEQHGFTVTRRYDELWESGAIQLTKTLSS